MSKKMWYSWEEMRRDVNVLCREIALDKFDPQVIVGISRGGLVPGVMMSHWFKKPFKPVQAALRDFPEWNEYLPRKTDERVLIVDDICDSGETLERISAHIIGPRKDAQEMAKDSTNTWIHFPHELWWNAPV
jgi:hypoxanthine phosphoribosyltransferase